MPCKSSLLGRFTLSFAAIGIASLPIFGASGCGDKFDSAPPPGLDPDGGFDPDGSSPDAAPPVIVTTPHESQGSRLTPVYAQYDGAEGSSLRAFQGWFDKEREEPCSFAKLADGKIHCAPRGDAVVYVPEETFQDAACLKAVVGIVPVVAKAGRECATPDIRDLGKKRYMRTDPRETCGATRISPFPTTPKLPTRAFFRKRPSGRCEAFVAPAEYEFYNAPRDVADLEPALFVTMSESDTTAGKARLAVSEREITGADGSKSSSPRVVDTQRGEFCEARMAGDGKLRCLPQGGEVSVASIDRSDSECKNSAYQVAINPICDGDGRNKFSSYMEKTDSCRRAHVYLKFSTQKLTSLYEKFSTGCELRTPDKGFDFYAAQGLTQEVAFANFAEMAKGPEDVPNGQYGVRGSRLAPRAVAQSSAESAMSARGSAALWDETLRDFCTPVTLSDGKVYCAPPFEYFDWEPQDAPIFVDDTCTEPALGINSARRACAGNALSSELFAERPVVKNGCQAHRIYRLPATPLAVKTTYWFDNNGKCSVFGAADTEVVYYRRRDCKELTSADLVGISAKLVK